MRASRRRGRLSVQLEPAEAHLLERCARDLDALLDGGEGAQSEDPLAALVGLPGTDPTRPADPALARLLPDAYGDDEEASGDFRRYTEADLRRGKRRAAAVVLATVPAGGGTVVLDHDQADAWLGCLNDLRLVLGTRLEVTDDTDLRGLDPAAPEHQALVVYGWLGEVQELLLAHLPRR